MPLDKIRRVAPIVVFVGLVVAGLVYLTVVSGEGRGPLTASGTVEAVQVDSGALQVRVRLETTVGALTLRPAVLARLWSGALGLRSCALQGPLPRLGREPHRYRTEIFG